MNSCAKATRIVAGMATMPSRSRTARRAIRSILPQVDALYLYLDGFDEVPEYAHDQKIVVLRSQDHPDLRANGKFLGLHFDEEATHYVAVDDDYRYPYNFVRQLSVELERQKDKVVMGIHGSVFTRPFDSFTRSRRVFTSWKGLSHQQPVDIVATCGTIHKVKHLKFDVREWKVTNQVDLHFAKEMIQRGMRGLLVPKRLFWVLPLAVNQPDSIFVALKGDDFEQTELAKKLFNLG